MVVKLELSGKVAIVTGAARGIGAAIAERLALEGVKVILVDILNEALKNTTRNLNEKGLKANYYCIDINNEADVVNVFESIDIKYGQVDILVNNAAISPKTKGKRLITHEIPLTEWEEVFRVNLTGTFLFTKHSLPSMVKNRWGRIINISSVAGRTYSRIAGSHYAATKSGMIGFSRTVASEYAEYGITINNIAPGRIETPMAEMVAQNINDDFINESPIEKVCEPNDIAEAVSFFCLKTADYITGSTMDINGGLYMN